jgi:dipeptidyl-peptidase 9
MMATSLSRTDPDEHVSFLLLFLVWCERNTNNQKMATKPTIAQLSAEIQELGALRGCFARPQKLSFVNNKLFWLEGMTQELYHAEISMDGPFVPQRTIVQGDTVNAIPAETHKRTKEEELLRERQRTLVDGISWFAIREQDEVVLYISAMVLYMYSPGHKEVLKVLDFAAPSVKELLGASPCINMQNVEGDISFSHFTFVCNSNVFLLHIVKELFSEHRLDVDVRPITKLGKSLSEFGTADYIMQEEFDRYSGHCARGNNVLMLHTDTSMLRKVSIPAENGDVEEIPFPRVGDPNALSSVAVYQSETGTFKCFPHAVIESIFADCYPLHQLALEYITRFGFLDDDTVFLQLLDRKQEHCVILSCPISALPIVPEEHIPRSCKEFHLADSAPFTELKSKCQVVWKQSIPFAWCEVTNVILLNTAPQLLGAHVESVDKPYFHLFSRPCASLADSVDVSPWVPLTSGDWNVSSRSIKKTTSRVFFEANVGDHLGNALCYVEITSSTSSASPVVISRPGERVHSFAVSQDEQYVAYVASTAEMLASLWVVRMQADGLADHSGIRQVPLDWALARNTALMGSVVRPQIVSYLNPRGVLISGAVFLPRDRDTVTRAPLMMYVYGGPHVQLVYSNAIEVACSPVIQTMLRHGIAVAVVDNQMSNVNHLKDLSVCKKRMGQFEVEEYVSFKKQLCEDPAFKNAIDSSRIGVFGWSYGGYATLLCMSQAKEEFKLGYSGAPVGDWRLYDTGYTERYMGLLDDVDDNGRNGYEDGRIARFADGFPDDLDRLFIAHGLLDENVHFSHSCDVISALVENCKPYQMLVYPGERHGLRQKKASRSHHDALMIRTLLEKL